MSTSDRCSTGICLRAAFIPYTRVYVNDINRHVYLGSCNLYADDTLIYCTGSNIVELKTNIQKCVTDVHEWYESNKFVINTSKSNVMLLTTRQMLSHMTDTDLNVHIGNHELLQCNNIKYLGVDIDNVLSWDIQTESISKKLVFIISRLSRLKPVFFHICLCIFIRALSNRKLIMQYRYGAIQPHIISTKSSGCKTELQGH